MDSRVARLSAAASVAGVTARTAVREVSPWRPPFSSLATDRPSEVPVASRITMRDTSLDALLRDASHGGTKINAPNTSGPNIVAMRNQRVRTRSRYSRAKTTRNLSIAGHALLDSGSAHPVNENPVQRRLRQLEAPNGRTRVHQPPQQLLRCRAIRQFHVQRPIRVVHAAHECPVREYFRDAVPWPRVELQQDVPAAVRSLHRCHSTVQHLLAPRQNTHRVAHALGLIHEVRAEDHRLPGPLHLDHDVLERLCIDGIETAEWLVEDDELRL